MKIRELKKTAGRATVSAWPPVWASAIGPGSKLAVGPVGVLEDLQRRDDDGLALTMKYDGREHSGVLSWTPPPSIDDVERALRANVGREISAISEVDV